MRAPFPWIALIVLLFDQPLRANPYGDSLIVVYTGGMRGRADGCGCSSGPEGGLDRRATLQSQVLNDAPYIALDCGGILDLDPAIGLQRSRCTVTGLARLRLKAISIGSRDLFYGTKFLSDVAAESGVELLSLNLVNSQQPDKSLYKRWLEIGTNGKTVAVTGISLPKLTGNRSESGSWISLPPDSMHALIAATHPVRADLTILLTDLDEASLRRFLNNSKTFDLAFTSSQQVYSATPFSVGKCLVERPNINGSSFEAIVIPPDGNLTTARFIRQPITRTTPKDPATEVWLRECLGNSDRE